MYAPIRLMLTIMQEFKLPTKRDLAAFLELDESTVSRVVSHQTVLNANHVLRIHEATGWAVAYIRDLAGDTSEEYFRSAKNFTWSSE